MSDSAQNPGDRAPQTVSHVLKGLMGQRSLGRRRRVGRDLSSAWIEVAGPELAGHTRLRGLRRGVLTIEVDSSPLCHQLASFRREELLLALKEKVKRSEIVDLRFRAGSLD